MNAQKISMWANVAGAMIAAGLSAIPGDASVPPWVLSLLFAVNGALHAIPNQTSVPPAAK